MVSDVKASLVLIGYIENSTVTCEPTDDYELETDNVVE